MLICSRITPKGLLGIGNFTFFEEGVKQEPGSPLGLLDVYQLKDITELAKDVHPAERAVLQEGETDPEFLQWIDELLARR